MFSSWQNNTTIQKYSFIGNHALKGVIFERLMFLSEKDMIGRRLRKFLERESHGETTAQEHVL